MFLSKTVIKLKLFFFISKYFVIIFVKKTSFSRKNTYYNHLHARFFKLQFAIKAD